MKKCRDDIYSWAKFWKLTVTWKKERRKLLNETRIFWECICECWNIKWIAQHNLGTSTKSCWCALALSNKSRATHNKTKDRIYRTWINMRERCSNPKDKSYSRYWWRWIIVCDRWKDSFENFYKDMWQSYELHVKQYWEKDTQIDRIDVNWNYCKENCRRATRKEQSMNKRK